MTLIEQEFVAFHGLELLQRGDLESVAQACKALVNSGSSERLCVFDDESGRVRDLDLSGTEAEVLERLREAPDKDKAAEPAKPKRRGRPKLGVISREVSLLPRHWKWLAEQRGGASARLRRLVESAIKNESGEAIARRAIDAAHRFMWDIAGDQPDFEEATRSLFACKLEDFETRISKWPKGIREQLGRYIERARAGLRQS